LRLVFLYLHNQIEKLTVALASALGMPLLRGRRGLGCAGASKAPRGRRFAGKQGRTCPSAAVGAVRGTAPARVVRPPRKPPDAREVPAQPEPPSLRPRTPSHDDRSRTQPEAFSYEYSALESLPTPAPTP